MEFIGIFDLACGLIFLLSCALIYTTYSIHNNSKYLDTLREEYFKLAGTAEVYLFEYDIPTDMLTMSQPGLQAGAAGFTAQCAAVPRRMHLRLCCLHL